MKNDKPPNPSSAAAPSPEGEGITGGIDLAKVPFAQWLEEILPELCRQDAKAIAIISVNKDGNVGTGYYNACSGDKGTMAWQLLLDGVWDMLMANAGLLRRQLEESKDEAEDEEGGTDNGD